MPPISKVKKRDNTIVDFDAQKITEAVWKAAQSVGGTDKALAEKISKQVCTVLEVFFKAADNVPSVEQIQDLVEKILIEDGHAKTAKAFILYREEHKIQRNQRSELLGKISKTKLTVEAIKLLKHRFLLRDEHNNVAENPEELFERIAKTACTLEKPEQKDQIEQEFCKMLARMDFIPGPAIMLNAGTKQQMLSEYTALPIQDSLKSIFETIKNTVLIDQAGGQVGLNFSALRPKGDNIESSRTVASGPIAFMKTLNASLDAIKDGTRVKNRHTVLLSVHHPDILEFITLQESLTPLKNLLPIVGLTQAFLEAVQKDTDYPLINPRTNEVVNQLNAKSVFELLMTAHWKKSEPGILMLSDFKTSLQNPTNQAFTKTELGLEPFETCHTGYINLHNVITPEGIDWTDLKQTVEYSVRLLDNLIDNEIFLQDDIHSTTTKSRKIGLGLIGFSQSLNYFRKNVGAEKALQLGEELMDFIKKTAKEASHELKKIKGNPENAKPWNQTLIIITPTKGLNGLTGRNSQEPDQIQNPEWSIQLQTIAHKYADASFLSPITVPENTSLEQMKQLLFSAYEKGVCCLRLIKAKHKKYEPAGGFSKYRPYDALDKQAAIPFNETPTANQRLHGKIDGMQLNPNERKTEEVLLPPIIPADAAKTV